MNLGLEQAEAAASDVLEGFFGVCRRASKKHGAVSSVVITGAIGAMLAAAMEGGCQGNLLLFYRWRDAALETINRHFDIAAARLAEGEKMKNG